MSERRGLRSIGPARNIGMHETQNERCTWFDAVSRMTADELLAEERRLNEEIRSVTEECHKARN